MGIIIKQPHNRVLEVSEDSKQITLHDSRYYQRNGEYYPSITHILQTFPKGPYFEDWLKKVGYNADYLVKQAAEEGTQVHNMIDRYLGGEELSLLNNNQDLQYSVDVWKMFLKFVEFWETYNPTLIDTEIHLFSDELKVAGTCDLVCKINSQLWLIDHKTSNDIHTSQELQVSVYGKCYEECFGIRPDRFGILWLKSSKRKFDIAKMQGKGWEVYESPRSYEENLELFKSVKRIFEIENPSHKPSFTELRTIAQRKL